MTTISTINIALLCALSFVAVAIITKIASILAARVGLVDKPGGRKKHDVETPLIGGAVLFPVFLMIIAIAGVNWDIYSGFFIAIVILIVSGVIDDRYGLSAKIKFIIQFIAALSIVFLGDAIIRNLGHFWGFGTGVFWIGFMKIPFSLMCVVLMINAMNLMDGLDGLAGGKAFICLCWLSYICIVEGAADLAMPIIVLMGSLCGFLIYNLRNPFRKRASAFLGDAGSMCLGLSLAWFSIHISEASVLNVEPIAIAWVLAMPVMDTCGQFIRRIKEGRHPFDPDRSHFHHHFVNLGLTAGWTTTIILTIGFLLGAIGVVSIQLGVPPYVLTYLWCATLIIHIYLSLRPRRYRKIIAFFVRAMRIKAA